MLNKILLRMLLLSLSLTANAWPGTVEMNPVGDETTWPDTTFRWMDVADFLYASDYQDNFVYNLSTVMVSFCDTSKVFRGTLIATGLKPNFAYQVKLVGKPEKVRGTDGDDWTNERLGHAGRWWRSQPDPGNTNDADYEAHKDNLDDLLEGYLLFAFFVTDERTEESFHQSGLGGELGRSHGIRFSLVYHRS